MSRCNTKYWLKRKIKSMWARRRMEARSLLREFVGVRASISPVLEKEGLGLARRVFAYWLLGWMLGLKEFWEWTKKSEFFSPKKFANCTSRYQKDSRTRKGQMESHASESASFCVASPVPLMCLSWLLWCRLLLL